MRIGRKITSYTRRTPVHLSLLALLLFCSCVHAQNIKVNGGFLSDSLAIGEQTAFYLSVHYPKNLTVLFPDSTHGFSPFEFQKKKYFPTHTEDSISVDSAVYYLTTFEVDRVQYLDLPVYVLQVQDCTAIESTQDSVLITQLVAEVPDSISIDKLPLKMNTAYQEVKFQFNYWIALIAAGVLIVIGIVVWLVFGKKIRIWFTTRKLRKRHLAFITDYNARLVELQKSFSAMITEATLSTWKKYMEQLEARPYTKLTTKETMNLIKDDTLTQNLRRVDAAIYGHNTTVIESLEALKHFADQRFSKKLEEVRHGQ